MAHCVRTFTPRRSCDADDGGSDTGAEDTASPDVDAEDAAPTLTSVSGVAQKGPLVAGSSLTLQVLDDTLTQTGDSFSADIQNDDGFFTLGDVDLDGNSFLEIWRPTGRSTPRTS